MYKFIKYIIFLSLLDLFLAFSECGFNKMKNITKHIITRPKKPKKLKEFPNVKIRQKISFYVDYTTMDLQSRYGVARDLVKKTLSEVITMYENLLEVYKMDQISLTTYETRYCDVRHTSYKTRSGFDETIILFPQFTEDFDEGILAAAGACLLDRDEDGNVKPRAGIVYINSNLNFKKPNSETYLKLLLFHELTHILVFDYDLYNYYIGYNGISPILQKEVNGMVRNLIATRKVVEVARKHFACDSLEGVELENQGGIGSAGVHWEGRIMMGDYMISMNYPEIVISDITLALFEDSGWYFPHYYTGGLFKFGKGEGCSFLNKRCIVNNVPRFSNEFCNQKDKAYCFNSLTAIGTCYLQDRRGLNSIYRYFSDDGKLGGFRPADYCPVTYSESKKAYFINHCRIGINGTSGGTSDNSLCFYNNDEATCAEVTCNENNDGYVVKVGDKVIRCESGGGIVEGFNCPSYKFVCTGTVFCNNLESCIELKSETIERTFTEDEVGDINLKNLEDNNYGRHLGIRNFFLFLSLFNIILLYL